MKQLDRIHARQDRIEAVPMPVEAHDALQFPEIAAARAHYASLSPERQLELDREWEA